MRLDDAAAKYMRSEISIEQFNEAKRLYAPDYHAIMMTLARLNRPPSLTRRFLTWLVAMTRPRTARSR